MSEYLKVHGQSLATNMALPQNSTEYGNGDILDLSGALGAFEVLVQVSSAITLADTTTLTVTLEHRDPDGTFEPLGTVCAVTASGELDIEAQTILGRFVPPSDTLQELRAVVTTDDAAATGSIDIFPHYLAR